MADEFDDTPTGDREYAEQGSSVSLIIAGIVAVAALIFVLQNSEDTTMEFLFFSAKVPLSFVIVVSIILGAILGWFFGFMRRRRKRSRID